MQYGAGQHTPVTALRCPAVAAGTGVGRVRLAQPARCAQWERVPGRAPCCMFLGPTENRDPSRPGRGTGTGTGLV